METIIITGIASGSGKTTLLSGIIGNLRTVANKIGVIKCSINDDFKEPLVTDDPEIINEEGTDTARLAKAGSDQTILIKSSRDKFTSAFTGAKKILGDVNYLLIEGNSAAKYLSGDLVIYLDSKKLEIKKSGEEARKKADIIIDTRDLFAKKIPGEVPFKFNLDKIKCSRALLTATIMDRKPILIGKKLNKEKVKLKGCQLGCF